MTWIKRREVVDGARMIRLEKLREHQYREGYVRVLHETLLVPVLVYGSETMIWKEERSRIMAMQMDNLRGLLSIRRMDRVSNARIRELCEVKKGLDERIDDSAPVVRPCGKDEE